MRKKGRGKGFRGKRARGGSGRSTVDVVDRVHGHVTWRAGRGRAQGEIELARWQWLRVTADVEVGDEHGMLGVFLQRAIERAPHVHIVHLRLRVAAEDAAVGEFVKELQSAVDWLGNLVNARHASRVTRRTMATW